MDGMMAAAAFGGLGGSGQGGGGMGLFGGGGMDSLLLMQTLAPLTEALTRIVDRLDAMGGGGWGGASGPVSPIATPGSLPYRDLIERLGQLYNVPAAFLGAVMMAESGGNAAAVGDEGHSVGLFQLHDAGMGRGLGDLRLDPELSAAIGARGLAAGWHEGLRRGLTGEELARFAYDYRFNPGGGDGYQGDSMMSHFRFYENLAERDTIA